MSSTTEVGALTRDEVERHARGILITVMSHFYKYDELPTLTKVSQSNGWRGAEARKAGMEFLAEHGFLQVDDTGLYVSRLGRRWIAAPDLTPNPEPKTLGLAPAGTPDEQISIVLWAENFYDRKSEWPSTVDFGRSGVMSRLGSEAAWENFNALVGLGVLALITVRPFFGPARRGQKTYVVPTRWCPDVERLNGKTFIETPDGEP